MGTLHLNSRVSVRDEVAVVQRATATSTSSKTQVLNEIKALYLTHSINACFKVKAKMNASIFSRNPLYVTA